MKTPSVVLSLAALLTLSDSIAARMQLQHKRLWQPDHVLHRRQQQNVPVLPDADATTAATTASASAAPNAANDDTASTAAEPSTARGVLGGLLGDDEESSSAAAPTTFARTTSSQTTPTPSSTATTSRSTSVSTGRTTITSGTEQSVVDVTSTVDNDEQETASASASAKPKSDDDDSGMSKKTMIILIVVASSVGLVAALWTLLRKWKFSPSRRFERRLNPIDWSHDAPPMTKDESKTNLTGATAARSGSPDALQRQNSCGSNNEGSGVGSLRNAGPAMSERGDAYSHITGGHERAAPTYPAYPPHYAQQPSSNTIYTQSNGQYHNQSSYSINTPYERAGQQYGY